MKILWGLSVLVLTSQLPAALTGEEKAADAPQHTPNAKLTAIAENTWEKVAGFAPTPGGILAYSGGVYDPVDHQFLLFGGGHADYWGNEVCPSRKEVHHATPADLYADPGPGGGSRPRR